jgi:uncharacterized protein
MTTIKNPRIELIDALRGFAIMAIILLHNIEHFEFYYRPEYLPEWLKIIDNFIWDSMFFLFGGKAYAIFALIFGFSFYIQNDNQNKKGNDFRGRFFWRMLLLLVFGFINTAFYQGDILTMYAILGLTLIPVCNWRDKTVFWLAVFLLLQPYEIIKGCYALLHPSFVPAANASESYYKDIAFYMQNGGFWDYVVGNVTLGKAASLLWSWENGRFFQAPALFMLGMLAGRRRLFETSETNTAFWKQILGASLSCTGGFLGLKTLFLASNLTLVVKNSAGIVVGSWFNFALMLVWVAGFVLLYQHENTFKYLKKLIPFGKMSLTNYIMQSIIGSTIYYKYGFGLYQYTGATMCLLIGVVLFLLQVAFCTWWLKTHKQGPLEYIWHKATWITFKK